MAWLLVPDQLSECFRSCWSAVISLLGLQRRVWQRGNRAAVLWMKNSSWCQRRPARLLQDHTKPTQQHLLQSRCAEEHFWLHNTLKLIADRLLQQKTALGDALSPWEMQTESTIRTNWLKLDIRRLEFFCFFRWRYDRMSLNFCCNIQIVELEYKHHESMDCS